MVRLNVPARIPKRWLVVTQYFPPEPGAPQIRLWQLAKQLQKMGCEVQVLTGMPNYPKGKIFREYRRFFRMKERIEGVLVNRLWLFPAGGKKTLRRLINYVSFTVHACCNVMKSKDVDMVFVEAQPITLALYGILGKILFGRPYIYNTPDLQVEIAGERGWILSKSLVRLAAALEKLLMEHAFSVSTVTHAFIDHFSQNRGIAKKKLSFLPNGVDTKVLQPSPYNEDYARKLGVVGKTVFTYAGTHADYQGLDVVLDAARILKEHSEIAFLMVGEGPERSRLIARAKSLGLQNVVFGKSPFEETELLMSITYASVVVLRKMPAAVKMRLSKTFPPLSCGVPVIYAGDGESAGLLVQNECGVVLEPENPEMLASAVQLLAQDRNRRDRLGRNGRAFVVRDLEWAGIIERWTRQLWGEENGLLP